MAASSDKDDWNFRELIEDREERHAKLRLSILWAARVQLVYTFARTAWMAAPSLILGQSMGTTDLAIFGAGVLLALLYSYAFGGGDPGRERSWAIQLYSVGGLCLGAECALMFYLYHILYKERPPLFEYPHIPSLIAHHAAGKLSRGTVKVACQAVEAAMEVVGLGGTVLGAYLVKEYVMDKREQAREEAEQREQTGAPAAATQVKKTD